MLSLYALALPLSALQPAPVADVVGSPGGAGETSTQFAMAGDDADGGEIVVQAPSRHDPADPLSAVNAKSFAVTQAIDEAVIGPVAIAYKRGLPEPLRDGLRNFLGNLHEPTVFVNFILQHKIGKAAETVGRFALNSTIGAAGLIDMAKRHPFNLPKRTNGFADTFGFYGAAPGAYMFLPVIGPTTVRDLIGTVADQALLPVIVGYPFNRPAYTIPAASIRLVDRRAEFDDELQRIKASADPYVARREFYLRKRRDEIDALRGVAPRDD